MKNKCQSFCIFVFLLVCIFFAVSGSKCNAEQFTFNVPVEIKNLQNVTAGRVSCMVLDGQGQTIPPTSINYANAEFPIVGGNYNGIATYSLSVQNPWTAKQYSCNLGVKIVGSGFYGIGNADTNAKTGTVSSKGSLIANLPQ
jgi:hypothetical protein